MPKGTKSDHQEFEADIATRIMERMVRMPPKPHKDMKLGKHRAKAGAKDSPGGKGARPETLKGRP
jgi:hypothetical protein